MPSIHLRGLSFAHSTALPVLRDVTLDLAPPPGGSSWVGVVGANGAGKSTLLHLLGGILRPTAGSLDVQASVPPLLVPQDVGALSDDVMAFAASWDGAAAKLRRRLDLDPDDLDPAIGRGWQAMSPGQRKRWQLATALATRPDVLLLDEPTNHLDVAARDLLLDALGTFRGLGLVVSHDRTLLDRLTDRTVRLHGRGAQLHAGSYTPAATRWHAEQAARRDAYDRAAREARRQRRILAEVRRDRHGAEAGPRRERRLAGAKEPDAREAGRKLAQQKAEAALAARVGQLRSRVARAEEAVDGIEIQRDHSGAVGFDHAASGRRVLAEVSGDVPHRGGEVWLTGVDVALHRGERVHLRGTNGAGKSTLITALIERLDQTSETVAVLPQELDHPLAEVVGVRRLDPSTRGRVLGVVALLGVDPDRVLTTDDPTPGESRKLALARLLAGAASVIVLDEPTNHLDLPSIERLETALQRFTGALVMVTHDDALAAATTTTTWTVRDRCVEVATAVR